MFKTLTFIINHPLNRRNPARGLFKWLRWQCVSRIQSKPIIVPFFNGSHLLVNRGMTGATGNIYCGLHEFESMGFLAHLLRANDVFIDIGANVGSYTILSTNIGAECYAFEPIARTYKRLCENIELNGYQTLAHPHPIAISNRNEVVRMSCDADTMNRIERSEPLHRKYTVEVQANRLDDLLSHVDPIAIKIDVEGAEDDVILGSQQLFRKTSLLAAIIEVNHPSTHSLMLKQGFQPYSYDPMKRNLSALSDFNKTQPNTLYLRNLKIITNRLQSAPQYEVQGQMI